MLIKLSSISSINEFPDLDYGRSDIDRYILNTISPRLDLTLVPDWVLIFKLHFCKANWIGIYKRGITYPTTKEKDVSIIIPIPDTTQATYGLKEKRFGFRPPLDDNKFWTLPVDFKCYEHLKDFITDSAKRGIHEAMTKGVTVSGKKVRMISPPESIEFTARSQLNI